MRILSIGNFTTGWDGSICDEEHIATSLEKLGHEVIRLQRETIGEEFPKDVIPYPVDFTLVAQWDNYPNLSNAPRPLVYWAFDYQQDGQEWHERLVKQADLYLSKPLSDSKYPNWQWLSQDFAPSFLDRSWSPEPTKKDIEILFTGSYLPWATERLETLKAIDDKYDLHIYSIMPNDWKEQGFKNCHGPVMDEGLLELIPRAKINISIDHTITPGYWSDRNAQVMACGGVVLFHYVELSESRFGSAIEYFYNTEDCLNKIDNLLNQNLTDKETIAWDFARCNLMVDNRVKDLLTIVEAHI